jgi:hypothetical protein
MRAVFCLICFAACAFFVLPSSAVAQGEEDTFEVDYEPIDPRNPGQKYRGPRAKASSGKLSKTTAQDRFFAKYTLLVEANEEAYSVHREVGGKYKAAAQKIIAEKDKSKAKTAKRYVEISKLFDELAAHNEAIIVYYAQKPTSQNAVARDKAFEEIPKVRAKIKDLGGRVGDRTWITDQEHVILLKKGWQLKNKPKAGDTRLPLLLAMWQEGKAKKDDKKGAEKKPVRR